MKEYIEDLEKRMSDMKKELAEELTKTVAEEVTTKVMEQMGNLSGLEARLKSREENLIDRAAKETMNRLKEKEERERKKNNLILYNLTESVKHTGAERQEEDTELCRDIFKSGLNLEESEFTIEKVIRIGTKDSGKMRPTLVRLKDDKMKWNI